MTLEHDRDNPDLRRLEAALRQFQPSAPPELAERILASMPRERTATPRRRARPMAWAAALAAAAILALAVLPRFSQTSPPPKDAPVVTEARIERDVQREAAAARLLVSANLLLAQPGGEALADRTLDYIARAYGDTDAARGIKQRTSTSMGVTQ